MNRFFGLIGGFINDQYISSGFRDRHLGKLPATDKKFIVSKDQSYRIGVVLPSTPHSALARSVSPVLVMVVGLKLMILLSFIAKICI